MAEYRLEIEYTDGMYLEKWFDTHEEAYWFVVNEGDHVRNWEII